jgi:hypothetical protein
MYGEAVASLVTLTARTPPSAADREATMEHLLQLELKTNIPHSLTRLAALCQKVALNPSANADTREKVQKLVAEFVAFPDPGLKTNQTIEEMKKSMRTRMTTSLAGTKEPG